MDNKFYDSFIAVIQKDHIGNIIDIIKKEDDCVRNEDDYIVLPLKEAVIFEVCPRLKTWDILRDSRLFPFLLHRLLLISQGEIPC